MISTNNMNEEYKGYTIEISQDCDCENPVEYDNLGRMVCFHDRYDLGNKHDFKKPNDLIRFLKRDKIISLPLYLLEHSGITISTSCRSFKACDPAGWDWGQVGYIYVDYETIRDEFSYKHITKKRFEQITEILNTEVEIYNQYLMGDVYYYRIIDSSGECIDSLGGIYGYDDTIDTAKVFIDNI